MKETAPLHVGHLIRLAQQVHTRMWASEVSSEVTSPQMQLLSVLATNPNIDQRTATSFARLDRSTGAELIERLARHGYIQRRRDRVDRRRYLLKLTPRGEEVLFELRPFSRLLHDKMLELVPEELREPFVQALQYFVASDEDKEQGLALDSETVGLQAGATNERS